MALFDDIGRQMPQTGQSAAQNTMNMTDTAQMNSMLAQEEKNLTAYYLQIGQLYVSEYGEDALSKFPDLVNQLYAAQNKVDELKNRIQELNGIKKCPSCGAPVLENANFCNVCGAGVASMPQMNSSNLLICPSCGNYVERGMKFCVTCGVPMAPAVQASTKVCAQCGNVLTQDMAFCNMCGTKYVEPSVEPISPPAAPSVEESVAYTAGEEVEAQRVCAQCDNVPAEDVDFCGACDSRCEESQAVEQTVVEPIEKESAPQEIICPNCGNELEPSAIYCLRCGTKVK
ncbi:MAG: zinc ribbon domain-containing protein [Clostridia bacterium]|nr:zinc ribbon domain-containing protein [Clostridia bacterium]